MGNDANHFILARKRGGRKEKAAANGFPSEGCALLKPRPSQGICISVGRLSGCHTEAFVTSDQKDSEKKKPNKLQNTSFVMHEIDQGGLFLKGKNK